MITKSLFSALGLAALFLAVATGLRYAQNAGAIEAEMARRAVQVLIGLGLAAYANLMPKQIGRAFGTPQAQSRAQAALRVGGWSFTLAGLAYAGLWAFAPLALADVASIVAVGSAMALTFGYAVWTAMACRVAPPAPSAH